MGDDAPFVAKSIKHMQKILQLPSTAFTYLIGASSGGNFVFEFAYYSKTLYELEISGICVQISPGGRHAFEFRIPVVFLHMPRDVRTANAVNKTIRALLNANVCTEEYQCSPKSLHNGDFFFKHGEALSESDSKTYCEALKQAGYLDSQGYLVEDPRVSSWRDIALKSIPHVVPTKDSLEADKSPISELMNVAWAYHEITDEFIEDTINFFEKCKPVYSE